MATHRILILVATTLALAGCADDKDVAALRTENSKLIAQVTDLQRKLDEQAGARAAEIEEMRRQASIAAACDVIVPVCPESVTEVGHKALENGYPSGGVVFWSALLAKLIALGSGMAAMFAVGGWLWFRLVMPEKEKAEAAAAMIEQAEAAAKEAEEAAERAQGKEAAAIKRIEEKQAVEQQLDERIEDKQAKLRQLDKEIAAKIAAQDALDSF